MSDAERLEDLRSRWPGWWWFSFFDLDGLAQRALDTGCLESAYVAAEATWWAGMGGSSNSSRTMVVFGPTGRTEDDEAFLVLLRHELTVALTGRVSIGSLS